MATHDRRDTGLSPARKALLDVHLTAIAECQKRARMALFLTTLASAAILAAEWNSYFSWDRQWADLREARAPAPWAREKLLEQQIKAWLETNGVNVSLLGLRVSVSDAAVLGSIILLVAAFYLYTTAKRENFEIAAGLREALSGLRVEQKYVYVHIRTAAVFERLADDDEAPIDDLQHAKTAGSRPLVPSAHRFLTYLPALTIIAIFVTDLYFAFAYRSPWSGNYGPAFLELPLQYRWQLIAMDLFAVIYAGIAMRFCHRAYRHQAATQRLIVQFRSAVESRPETGEEPSALHGLLKRGLIAGAIWRAVVAALKRA